MKLFHGAAAGLFMAGGGTVGKSVLILRDCSGKSLFVKDRELGLF